MKTLDVAPPAMVAGRGISSSSPGGGTGNCLPTDVSFLVVFVNGIILGSVGCGTEGVIILQLLSLSPSQLVIDSL